MKTRPIKLTTATFTPRTSPDQLPLPGCLVDNWLDVLTRLFADVFDGLLLIENVIA